jgi:putative Holliday junction resolvase
MSLIEVPSLLKNFEPNTRLLVLDVGSKTIGLALSDLSWTIATPLETLKRKRFRDDVQILQSLINDHRINGLIIGLPVNMNGSEGAQCRYVRQFTDNLLREIDIPISFWDERLSTVAVTRILLEADLSRVRRKQLVDKMAATYILQGALDSLQKEKSSLS